MSATSRPGSRWEDAVWVADSIENNVRRIVPAGAGVVTNTTPFGNGPGPIAAGESAIWVANSRDGTVSRIDPATRAVVARNPRRAPPVRHHGRRRRGLGGEQPLGDGVAHRSAHEPRREDDRCGRGAPVGRRGRRSSVGHDPGAPAEPGAGRWPGGGARVAGPVPGHPRSRGHERYATPVCDCARLMTYASRSGSGAAELVPELPRRRPRCPRTGAATRSGSATATASRRRPGEPVTAAAFERSIERLLRNPVVPGVAVDDIVGARGVPRAASPRPSRACQRAETSSRSG